MIAMPMEFSTVLNKNASTKILFSRVYRISPLMRVRSERTALD